MRPVPPLTAATRTKDSRLVPSQPVAEAWLTPREAEVLLLSAVGLTNEGCGAHLGISTLTARGHMAHVKRKLGVATTAGAVGYVLVHGWPPVRRYLPASSRYITVDIDRLRREVLVQLGPFG